MKTSALKMIEKVFSAASVLTKGLPKISAPLAHNSTQTEIEEYQRLALQIILERAAKTDFYKTLFKKHKINVRKCDDFGELRKISYRQRFKNAQTNNEKS